MTPKLTEVFVIHESNMTLPIVRPKDVDPDSHWTHEMGERFWKSISPQNKTWDSKYDSEARRELHSMIQRLVEEMIVDDFEHLKLKDVKTHGYLKLMKLPPDKLVMRGDLRYGSEDLARVVKSGSDLVPIAVGARSSSGPYHVLDGHHRTRAYMLAQKDALCLVGWVDKSGRPGEITFES